MNHVMVSEDGRRLWKEMELEGVARTEHCGPMGAGTVRVTGISPSYKDLQFEPAPSGIGRPKIAG